MRIEKIRGKKFWVSAGSEKFGPKTLSGTDAL